MQKKRNSRRREGKERAFIYIFSNKVKQTNKQAKRKIDKIEEKQTREKEETKAERERERDTKSRIKRKRSRGRKDKEVEIEK